MMKRFFVIALFVLGLGQLYAQPVRDTAWTKAGYFGLKNMEKKRDASVAPLFLSFHLHILFFCLFVVTLSDKIVIIFR